VRIQLEQEGSQSTTSSGQFLKWKQNARFDNTYLDDSSLELAAETALCSDQAAKSLISKSAPAGDILESSLKDALRSEVAALWPFFPAEAVSTHFPDALSIAGSPERTI
jgi:hypothetical protein